MKEFSNYGQNPLGQNTPRKNALGQNPASLGVGVGKIPYGSLTAQRNAVCTNYLPSIVIT